MGRKLFFLWVLTLLLAGVFLPVLDFVVVGADGSEEAVSWCGHSNWQQLTRSSSYQLGALKEWNKTYGGTEQDWARSVEQASDGGYIVVGVTASFGAGKSDAWLIKTDAYGEVEWNKTYGRAGYDGGNSVKETGDGGYILAGSRGANLWLVKTDAYGNMVWNKTYGGASWDDAYSVHQTTDGGYVVAGYTASLGAGGSDYWLIKTDAYGNVEWNKTYGGGDSDKAYSVEQTSDGGYIMVGSANSFKTGVFDGEIWLVKTDAYGDVEWSWLSGWPDWDFAYSVQQTADGGYIVAGTRFSSYDTRYDFWLIKIDANGSLEWDSVFARAGRSEDVAYSVGQSADGGYIVAGGWGDFWVVKTDGYGNMEWRRSYGGADSETARSIRQASDGGYIVAGDTESFGFGKDGYPDAWVVKFFPVHDVAVDGVEPSKTVVGQGYSLSVNVTVKNRGFFLESFNVTTYANATAIGTQGVYNLSQEVSTTLTFMLDTAHYVKGSYILSAYAWPVFNETKLLDNIGVDGWVLVSIPGDVDGDRDVDLYDLVQMADVYGLPKLDPRYNTYCDVDDDGDVDIYDVVAAARNYGKSW